MNKGDTMNTLFLYDTKTMRGQINTKIFAGDNLITKINVQLPDNIGGYPKRECEYNLRAIIPEGNLSYMIEPSQPYFYVTNDITEKAQIVKLMMIITHEGNVIGRTNTVDLIVNEPAEAPDPPLTPRAEFDEVIAEQRAEIAEQAETISEQASQIEQDTETISGLNTQVSELTTENEQQAETITRQNQTIDQLNSRVPALEQLDPINPSDIQQTLTPESPNIGFPQVIVNPVTAEGVGFNKNYYKKDEEFLGEVGTYNPLPEGSDGGLYFKFDEENFPTEMIIYNWDAKGQKLTLPYSVDILKTNLKKFTIRNCNILNLNFNINSSAKLEYIYVEGLEVLGQSFGFNCAFLKEAYLKKPLREVQYDALNWSSNLETLHLPNTLTTLPSNSWGGPSWSNLRDVVLENGFNCNGMKFNYSTLLSAETLVAMLEALADRTGLTAYTLTIGTPNINKLTAEQIAIATNKNWDLT